MQIRAARGFTIIETLVVLGIGSVVVMSMYTMLDGILNTQAFLDSKMDLRQLTAEVQTSLANPVTCLSSFESNFTFNPTQAARPTPLGQSVPGLILANGETMRPAANLQRYSLTLDALRLVNAQATTPGNYRTVLEAQFKSSKGKNLSFQMSTLGTLNITVDAANKITGCVSAVGGGGGGSAGPVGLAEFTTFCRAQGSTVSTAGGLTACRPCNANSLGQLTGYQLINGVITGICDNTPAGGSN